MDGASDFERSMCGHSDHEAGAAVTGNFHLRRFVDNFIPSLLLLERQKTKQILVPSFAARLSEVDMGQVYMLIFLAIIRSL